jgi:hypothetical protein
MSYQPPILPRELTDDQARFVVRRKREKEDGIVVRKKANAFFFIES